MKYLPVLLTGVVMWMACSARTILVQPENIHEEQRVVLRLKDNTVVSGTALRANDKSILLLQDSGDERIIFVKNISSASGPEPIFDDSGRLISEMEIDSLKTNANKTAYAIAGGAISLGMSVLAGTLVEREYLHQNGHAAIYTGMAAGTAVGAALFTRAGARKDREAAIEYVLDSRSQADEILSLPDDQTDKLIKAKIQEIIAQRLEIENEIDQVLRDIEELDNKLAQKSREY